MAIDLVEKFLPYVDEQFTTESKKSLLTNQDFNWTGAHTVKVYKVSTSAMNDYDRNGVKSATQWSRYGAVAALDAVTEEYILTKDRSFTFAIDKLDTDETAQQLAAASVLARQNREVVIPEVDRYVYGVMCQKAGTKPTAKTLTAENIYTEILAASLALDNAEVPETGRVLVLTPAVYVLLKKCSDVVMETDIGNDLRLKGAIGILDGMTVQKIPAVRLPDDFGFMIAHPCATVAPVKLEDYRVHQDPPAFPAVWLRDVSAMTPLSWTIRPGQSITRPSPSLHRPTTARTRAKADQMGRGGSSPCAPFFAVKCKIHIVFRHKKEVDFVSRWRNNGGWNKSHGTVEKTSRIDNFEINEMGGWGMLFAYRDGKMLFFDCDHFTDYGPETDQELVELYYPKEGWNQTLELSRIPSASAGAAPFGCVRPVGNGGGICT